VKTLSPFFNKNTMAIKHNLSLEIPHIVNPKILRIVDTSIYADTLPTDCHRLDIYTPGAQVPIYYTTLDDGFIKNLSAIDLFYQNPQDGSINTIADGVYKIRYSVSPNDLVYVEYYHLRTTLLMQKYNAELCKVKLETNLPSKETLQKLNDLRLIKSYIDAAIAKTEYCHVPQQGADMFNYAATLLEKYMTGCCIICK